jgi:serine/threonine protein kinase
VSEARTCRTCGAPIPEDAPGGSCPACALRGGLGIDESDAAAEGRPLAPEELQRLLPHLEVSEIIGQGGMGVVYAGRQAALDRAVAIKVLPRRVADDPAFAERFRREAKAMARLQHPNIVAVHEAGEVEGTFYLVMEMVGGVNLRQAQASGRVSPEEALAIVPQICDALQYAHDQGVVHRDVKPENILLERSGRVKIADFGLAKLARRGPTDASLTAGDQVLGTYHYMAPEQIRTPKEVDHRADIYSLGVVIYEMLTGGLPVGRFPPPSQRADVDARIDEVVLRALEREREQRWQRADEVKTGVQSVASGAAPRPAMMETPPLAAPARLSMMALIGFLCAPLSLVLLVVVGLLGAHAAPSLLLGGAVLLVGVLLSIVAWVRIAPRDSGLRGLPLAILGVFLPLVLPVPLVGWLTLQPVSRPEPVPEVTMRRLEAPEVAATSRPLPAPLPPPPLVTDRAEALRVLLGRLEQTVGGMTDLEALEALVAPADRAWIKSRTSEQLRRIAQEGTGGLPLFDLTKLPAPLTKHTVDMVDVHDGRGTARLVWKDRSITFPVAEYGNRLFFGVGPVHQARHER